MTTRRESVQLSLVDAGFSTGMARAAASAALLDKQLNRLDGTQIQTTRSTDRLSESAVMGSRSIDRFSGRMGILLKAAAVLGPALVPLGAVGIAGVAGLANQLGFAAIAAGTVVAAFQGIGDTLTAVNKASLDPTVENLQAAHEALMQLTPAGRAMVTQLDQMRPILTELRNTAQEGLFPGLVEGFESLERLAPSIDGILRTVSETLGDLFAEGAESLAGDRWADFFSMIEREARPTLTDLGHTLGSVVHGLSEMWEAFAPLNRDFGSWLADAAQGFDKWATGLSKTEGFKDFIAYIRENGPVLADAMSSIGNALVQIVQAAAPLGGPVLQAITHLADAIATIADSPLGTPIMAGVTALSAMSLAANVATASMARLNAAIAMTGKTSKATGAATATGAAAGAGPAGIAALVGLTNVPGEVDFLKQLGADALSGEKNIIQLSEGVGRFVAAMNPAGQVAQMFGLDILGMGDDAEESAAGLEFLGGGMSDFLALLSEVKDFDGLDDALGDLREGFGLEPVIARTTRAMRDQARAMRASRAEAARSNEQFRQMQETMRANREAAQAAAEGFVDFGRKAKASEFTLDGWLDKIEDQTEAMRRFRENAVKAFQKGVDPGLIQDLREMGREGAVQLRELANANEETIDRANRDWRSYQREIRRAGQDIDATQRLLHGFGTTDSRAHIGVDGVPETAAAAARARAAVLNVPETHTTSFKEDGAAIVAAAAARARAAITSIPTSWHSTITVSKVGSALPGLSSGGYTGPGDKYEPRGIVHADEVVLPKEIVRRDWSMLKSRYGHLPGFADGGLVPARPVAASAMGGSNVVRHVFEHHVTVTGALDAKQAVAQLRQEMRAVSRDEIDQDRTFAESQR